MSNKKGFTLIEMAVVLVVIGLIVGTIVPLLITQSKTARLKEGKELLRTARDEILGYALTNNACLPENLDKIGHTKDPWGNEIFYRPANALVCPSDLCGSGITSTSLNMTTPDETKDDVAFVLASKGPNYSLQIANSTNHVEAFRYGEIINSKEFDDLYEYVTLGQLKTRLCSTSGNGDNGGGGTDISFAKNISEFSHIIESQNGVINVDEESKTITIGGSEDLASGCIWYGQDTGPCTEGVCDLGSGFRAFFRFKSLKDDTSQQSTDYGSGFTFAVTSDTESPPETVCGGNGAHLGYAGTQPDDEYWIGEPKMGVEVDYYQSNNGGNNWCFNKDDPNANHVANLFWGYAYAYRNEAGIIQTTGEDICNGPGGEGHNGDDNRHGAGEIDDYHSKNPEKNSEGCDYDASNKTWLENAQEHTLRIDLNYNSTSGDAGLRAWVDVEGSNNTAEVMSEDPDITAEMVISPELFREQMEKIRFGWTVGSSDEQAVELSDFKINFLDYNSTNST